MKVFDADDLVVVDAFEVRVERPAGTGDVRMDVGHPSVAGDFQQRPAIPLDSADDQGDVQLCVLMSERDVVGMKLREEIAGDVVVGSVDVEFVDRGHAVEDDIAALRGGKDSSVVAGRNGIGRPGGGRLPVGPAQPGPVVCKGGR